MILLTQPQLALLQAIACRVSVIGQRTPVIGLDSASGLDYRTFLDALQALKDQCLVTQTERKDSAYVCLTRNALNVDGLDTDTLFLPL